MSLPTGTRIGPYEVTGVLGAGGMGEVYRARDGKLNRDVALKVLPDLLTNDPERVARFRREAQVLAALNHPNIAHVYGFEDAPAQPGAAPVHAIVMELVEGPTLADRIAAGAIPWADALPIARQVADALEAAHEQGIVHRDLKPANIKAKDDGTVKVLDFGLAKALGPDGSGASGDASNSPTLTARGTQMGMILGTAAYMAPEQARGRAVDRRADIWAFGVVLFEMLTGRRAFEGEDISITLASVLKEDVDWQALPSDLPAPLRRLLRRCLEKDPKRRLSAIGDARLELDESHGALVPDGPAASSAAAAEVVANLRRRATRAWITAAGLGIAAVVSAVLAFWGLTEPPRPTQRAQFLVTDAGEAAVISAPAPSPDGALLAFVARSPGGGNQVHVRPLDGLEMRALAGTDGANSNSLFWIDGSKAIGFTVGPSVYRVDATGGTPQRLCEMDSFAGATWLPSGEILMAQFSGADARLFRVPAQGGEPVEVARQNGGDAATKFVGPAALPGGRRFLYMGWSGVLSDRALYSGSLDGAAPVRLVASDSVGAYAEPGFLLFVRGGVLFAQRFNASTLEVSGDPIRIADDISMNMTSGRASFGVSNTGVLAYRTGGAAAALSDLAWFDRSGKALGTVGDAGSYYQIRLSPDGRRVALAANAPGSQVGQRLSVLDLGNGVASALPAGDLAAPNDPAWSPDGESLAFEAIAPSGHRHLYTQRIGGAPPTLAFESADTIKWLTDWSPDGKFLLFVLTRPSKLFAVPMDEPRTARLLLETPEAVDGAHFSPDSKWVVYQITENGTYQVWVASFPAFDQRRRISPQGGGQAFWRGDGREIFYLTPTGKMMSVAVTPNASGALDFGAPVELFQSPRAAPNLTIDLYSVTKDGQRFLFIRPRETTAARQPVSVVINWAEGLTGR